MTDSTTYEERKKLFDNMKILVIPEQEEVYRILRRGKDSYTENSNGIFFDLANINEDTFLKIREYIEFCINNRKDDETRLKELQQIRIENDLTDINFDKSNMIQ